MLFFLIVLALFEQTIGWNLFDTIVDSIECDCFRSTDLDVSQIKIQLNNYQSGFNGSGYFAMTAADEIVAREDFNPEQCVVVFVTGYKNTIDGNPSEMVRCALSRVTCEDGKRPLLLIVDHSYYTTASNIFEDVRLITFYKEAASISKSIGYAVGKFLVNLLKSIDRQNLYVVGHSLGAHIAGYAGEYVYNTTEILLENIYGVDPSAPCFDGCAGEHLRSGLAETVITIHCDAGEQGTPLNIADYDFYSGNGESQAPCESPTWGLFRTRSASSCSHNACLPIAFTPSYESSGWIATKCDSYEAYSSGSCASNESTSDVGFMKTPTTSNGVYYFVSPSDLECYIT